jgi:predicted transcriptional regulator
MKSKFEKLKTHLISILIIINFIFLTNLLSPVQAQFNDELDFYAGILLYAPDFSYDLSPLDEMAENGEVIIIDEYSDLVELGIEDGGTDFFDDDTSLEEPGLLGGFETGLEPGFEGDLEFIPGTYYVYPSHYNPEVGVVIYEVKNSLVYPEANHLQFENYTKNPLGFEENSEGAWENISGLSVNLVIPAEIMQKKIDVTVKTLSLDYEIELNETITWFMDELGYFDSGFSVYQANSNNESKVVSLTYEKANVELWLSSGMGGQVWDDITFQNQSKIQLVFQGTVVDDSIDSDVKKLLNYLQINPDEWDNAKVESESIMDFVLSPTIDIVDEEFNWITAMHSELTWLAEQGIISGISDQKIREIADSTIAGYDVFAVQKTPEQGYLRFELGEGAYGDTSSQFSEIVDKALGKLKEGPDKPGPKEFIPLILLQVIAGIIVISAIGTFAYTRIKRRNILDNINRKNIFEYIKSNQGVHFKALLRKLNFQPGAMSYHLNVLEKGEFIKSIQDGNLRRFYLYGTKSDFKIALTSIQLRILSIVDERPGISQSKISELLGKNRMLVNYHIKILDDADLISMEKEGRVSKVFTTGNAETYLS